MLMLTMKIQSIHLTNGQALPNQTQWSFVPLACDACPSSAVDRGKIVGKFLPLALNKCDV